MIPAAFDYVRPGSLAEALKAIGQPGAKVIAGGQSLLPLLKMRLASAERLVDIGRLGELKGVTHAEDGGVRVGALTTYAELIAATKLPWVREALEGIGDVQVRNVGTVGGAIAHCDPASDMPAILLALDGEVVLRSASGERVVPASEFFTGTFETAMEPDELLVELRRPPLPRNVGAAYRTLEQPASGYSMVGVAAVLGHEHGVWGSSTIDHVRVAITGVADRPYRATAVEQALLGTDCSPDRIAAAAEHATDGVTVNSDIHADREYRTAMAKVYVRRALEAARARSA
jgi:carbon-monoxide dehydrogenase medium subunit